MRHGKIERYLLLGMGRLLLAWGADRPAGTGQGASAFLEAAAGQGRCVRPDQESGGLFSLDVGQNPRPAAAVETSHRANGQHEPRGGVT
jgi:hypothetical protein